MSAERKVTTLELSRELREAGAPQGESERVWAVDTETKKCSAVLRGIALELGFVILADALDCYELLERLPMGTRLTKALGGYGVELYGVTHSMAAYPNPPVSMLGQLYLWCLQNDRKDVEKVGGGS